MPAVNSLGQIIPNAELTKKEQKQIAKLSNLKYPKDEAQIFHLSPSNFKLWLYIQDPKEALLWCSTEGLSLRIRKQTEKKGLDLVSDFIWRFFYG